MHEGYRQMLLSAGPLSHRLRDDAKGESDTFVILSLFKVILSGKKKKSITNRMMQKAEMNVSPVIYCGMMQKAKVIPYTLYPKPCPLSPFSFL
jgi:hypothetical protein